MPSGSWSKKDERKYEHIKSSSRKRGESPKRSKEIAARTVNKGRREEGRTRSPSKPNGRAESRSKSKSKRTSSRNGQTRDQLYQRAKQLGIQGRSKMNKSQLAAAVGRRS